jgi:hypothetical protein
MFFSRCAGKPEMARTSAFFGSVTQKAFCQKKLKFSFPAPFFFVPPAGRLFAKFARRANFYRSTLFGRTKRNELYHARSTELKIFLISRSEKGCSMNASAPCLRRAAFCSGQAPESMKTNFINEVTRSDLSDERS